MKFLLVALTLAACGNASHRDAATSILVSVESDFSDAYDEYQHTVVGDPRLSEVISIEPTAMRWTAQSFDEPGMVVYAECQTDTHTVLFTKNARAFTAPQLKGLVFHELTHCRFLLDDHDPRPGLIFSAGYDYQKVLKNWPEQVDTLIEYIAAHGIRLKG